MNLLDLFVNISVEDDASKEVSSVGDKIKGTLGTAAKAAGAAVAAVGAGAVAIGKSALDAYASYEQLVGGVDKLYGDASGKLQAYASDAYRTAGMSANQYMEQATSFSSSLISSVGGDVQEAADLTDLAMRSISDNVNVFGSNMEDVQNAFQGFAKGNYDMLDNLKLGYGGTQAEMQRLVQEAANMTDAQEELGVTVDGTSMSFGNIVKAIAVVEQNMGVMGTTTKEAAGTIEGSMAMASAAWDNFLTGLANPDADLGELTDQLLESVGNVVSNVVPRVAEIADGMIDSLPEIFSTVGEVLGPVIRDALIKAWNIGAEALSDFGIDIPQIDTEDVETALGAVNDAITTLKDNADWLVPSLGAAVGAIGGFQVATTVAGVVQGVATAIQTWKTANEGLTISQTILNAVMNANPFVMVATIIGMLVGALVTLWTTNEDFRNAVTEAWNSIKATAETVWNAVVNFFTVTVPEAINNMLTFFQDLPGNIAGFLSQVWTNVSTWASNMVSKALETGQNFLKNVVDFFNQLPGRVGYFIGQVLGSIVKWVLDMGQNATKAGSDFLNNVVNFITQLPGNVANFLSNVITNVGHWVLQMAQNARNAGMQFLQNVVNFVRDLPGNIANFLSNTISNVASFVSDFGGKALQAGQDFLTNIVNEVGKIPGRMLSIGRDIVEGVWNGIKNAAGWFSQQIGNFFGGIVDGAKAALGIASPSKVMRREVGRWIPAGVAAGIDDEADLPVESMDDMMGRLTASSTGRVSVAGGGSTVSELIAAVNSLHEDLGDIIADRTPVMTRREFSRSVRSVVVA